MFLQTAESLQQIIEFFLQRLFRIRSFHSPGIPVNPLAVTVFQKINQHLGQNNFKQIFFLFQHGCVDHIKSQKPDIPAIGQKCALLPLLFLQCTQKRQHCCRLSAPPFPHKGEEMSVPAVFFPFLHNVPDNLLRFCI